MALKFATLRSITDKMVDGVVSIYRSIQLVQLWCHNKILSR